MRVMLVTGSFPPMKCGVGDYTACLADALAGQPEVEVAVLTSKGAAGRERGGEVEIFPLISEWVAGELASVKALVRDWKPDVVHAQYPTLGYRAGQLPWMLPWKLRREVPVVETWHEHFPDFVPGWYALNWGQYAMALSKGDVVVVRPRYRKSMPLRWRLLTLHRHFQFIPSASAIPHVVLTEAERRAIRARFGEDDRALIVFFGFFYEHKGIDELLQVLDFQRERLVLVGEVIEADPYQARLVDRLRNEPFAGSVFFTGFLSTVEAARVLAAADAVALPLRAGAGIWNTSLHAAILQGTFLLTTSLERHGYDPEHNVYYARPRDLGDLKHGLETYLGRRNPKAGEGTLLPRWSEIAKRHVEVYRRQRR